MAGAPVPLHVAELVAHQRWIQVQQDMYAAFLGGQYTKARSMLDRFINEYGDKEKHNGENHPNRSQ